MAVEAPRRTWINEIVTNGTLRDEIFRQHSAVVYVTALHPYTGPVITTQRGQTLIQGGDNVQNGYQLKYLRQENNLDIYYEVVTSADIVEFNDKLKEKINKFCDIICSDISRFANSRIEVYFVGALVPGRTKEDFKEYTKYPNLEFAPIDVNNCPQIIFVYNELVQVPSRIGYFGSYSVIGDKFTEIDILVARTAEEFDLLIATKRRRAYNNMLSRPIRETYGIAHILLANQNGVPVPLTNDIYYGYVADTIGNAMGIEENLNEDVLLQDIDKDFARKISNTIYIPSNKIAGDKISFAIVQSDGVANDIERGRYKAVVNTGKAFAIAIREALLEAHGQDTTVEKLLALPNTYTIIKPKVVEAYKDVYVDTKTKDIKPSSYLASPNLVQVRGSTVVRQQTVPGFTSIPSRSSSTQQRGSLLNSVRF